MGLIDDLRLDIGDDEELFAEACSPEIWCATVVTDKVYDKKQTDTILFVNPTLPGPTIINLGASPILGKICVIKDMKGDANVNPIIISFIRHSSAANSNRSTLPLNLLPVQQTESLMIRSNLPQYLELSDPSSEPI